VPRIWSWCQWSFIVASWHKQWSTTPNHYHSASSVLGTNWQWQGPTPYEPLRLRCHQAARTRKTLARCCVAPLGLASDGFLLRCRFLSSALALHWNLKIHQDHLFITEVQHQFQLPPPKGPTGLTMRRARLSSAWVFHRCTAPFACCRQLVSTVTLLRFCRPAVTLRFPHASEPALSETAPSRSEQKRPKATMSPQVPKSPSCSGSIAFISAAPSDGTDKTTQSFSARIFFL